MQLVSGAAAGVKIPDLSSYDGLQFDFRIRYDDISSLSAYLGNKSVFENITSLRKWVCKDVYIDNNSPIVNYKTNRSTATDGAWFKKLLTIGNYYELSYLDSIKNDINGQTFHVETEFSSVMAAPDSYLSPGYKPETSKYGWMDYDSVKPVLQTESVVARANVTACSRVGDQLYATQGTVEHYTTKEYIWSPNRYIPADFNYDNYKDLRHEVAQQIA